MVAMAAFGAMTAVLMGNASGSPGNARSGWVRQLRLTALPGRGYVIAKIAGAGDGQPAVDPDRLRWSARR